MAQMRLRHARLMLQGLIVAVVSARFRDIPIILTNVLQVVFFITPIFWDANLIKGKVVFIQLNYFYHLLQIVRAPLLGQEAATVPAGCEGLVMVPHLQGAMAPENNGEARGALVGLTLRHGRAHVARAILESISFVIRRNIEVLESLGTEIPEIRSLGGGSRSRVWKQIEADVTGRPVALTQQEEAATLGAAILAGVGTGLYAHAPEAAARMVHVRETFEPDPRQVKTYDDYYGLYQETYDALCPVYSRLAGVTR